MGSAQAGVYHGTQDAQGRKHSFASLRPTDKASRNCQVLQEDPIEVDESSYMSPEIRALLSQDAQQTHLEVDEDGDEEADDEPSARSVYAMSMYPGAGPSFQVEEYENGQDSATIDSARTLYADDVDFVIENGRQYCGDYFLPIDQTEQTRQYVIHQVYLKLFDLELTTVPLENPTYILDIGTGIGEWAIGMAEKYPQCEVFGTDIAPIQPTQQVPFNVEFHIENAEEEWIRPANAVDLVHLRNMEGAFSDWSFIYNQAFECIKPGGWIEVIDLENYFADKNYLSFYPENSAPSVLIKAFLEAAERAGKPRGAHHLNKDLLAKAGFVDIKDSVYDLGIGSRENSNYGKFWLFTLITGIEATALRLLTKYLGWDPDDVRELCEEVARETKAVAEDPARVEAFVVKLRVVVGRKPMSQEHGTPGAMLDLNGDREHSADESTIGRRTIRSEQTA
ncbi:S-adenosyl-L-methionine-dependent methyltransferase [Corynascus novoguineensis]|uniref:S-adenosyl-L-methionine-dependent methyltransferase n=1 Tax=Corynascus novoguineensis TaxID=1126955 RepID=A0AAN7CWZ1_9PEZI|nr:S-adenosyl-L-methionine-dependent methyltransferase [Corynascus novoguineensis]